MPPFCFTSIYTTTPFVNTGHIYIESSVLLSRYLSVCWRWVMLHVTPVLLYQRIKPSGYSALNHFMQIMPLMFLLFFFFTASDDIKGSVILGYVLPAQEGVQAGDELR